MAVRCRTAPCSSRGLPDSFVRSVLAGVAGQEPVVGKGRTCARRDRFHRPGNDPRENPALAGRVRPPASRGTCRRQLVAAECPQPRARGLRVDSCLKEVRPLCSEPRSHPLRDGRKPLRAWDPRALWTHLGPFAFPESAHQGDLFHKLFSRLGEADQVHPGW